MYDQNSWRYPRLLTIWYHSTHHKFELGQCGVSVWGESRASIQRIRVRKFAPRVFLPLPQLIFRQQLESLAAFSCH